MRLCGFWGWPGEGGGELGAVFGVFMGTCVPAGGDEKMLPASDQ